MGTIPVISLNWVPFHYLLDKRMYISQVLPLTTLKKGNFMTFILSLSLNLKIIV